jgi:threonine aldolase
MPVWRPEPPPAAYGPLVDSLSFCFSKGLGAPVGSVFLGTREAVTEARVLRRRLGGAMRQVGVLAAAALYALDHHVERLAEDHANARAFAHAIRELRHLRVDPEAVETNLVLFDLDPPLPDAAAVVARMQAKGVLLGAVGPRRIRAVTHLDVTRAEVLQAARALHEVLEQTTGSGSA